jgi:hypothetical protein
MTDKAKKPPAINHKSVERFENEGGTTKAGELARRKRPADFAQRAKMIVDIATGEIEDREPSPEEQGKDPAAVSLGRRGGLKGGKARAKSLSPKRRAQIAKAAAEARWKKT